MSTSTPENYPQESKKERLNKSKHADESKFHCDDVCPAMGGKAKEPEEKPQLNGASLIGLGNYRLLYEIEAVDVEHKLWRGRPIPTGNEKKHSSILNDGDEHHWIYFHRNYDFERNDWDRLYREHDFLGLETFGVLFLAVPKEKILFAYDEAAKEGILTVKGGRILGGPGSGLGGIIT